MTNLNILKHKIEIWGAKRGFVKFENRLPQCVKLQEECGELARAIIKNNNDDIKDALGDIFVVLTLLANMQGYDIADCVLAAYHEIKDREGQIVNGSFVKQESEA